MTLVIDPDADHDTVVKRGAMLLGLNPQHCSLVHMNGSKVGNCDIMEGDNTYLWTIGRYIGSTYAKSSSYKHGLFDEDQDTEVM